MSTLNLNQNGTDGTEVNASSASAHASVPVSSMMSNLNLNSPLPSSSYKLHTINMNNDNVMPSSSSPPPGLLSEEEDDNDDENSVQDQVLGFTHSLLSRIQQSKSLLDSFIKQQRNKADDIVRQQANVHEVEKEEIGNQIEKLKELQLKRGLIANDDDHDGDGGLTLQQAELDKKLVEVEKELQKCQLDYKKVDKNVKGTL